MTEDEQELEKFTRATEQTIKGYNMEFKGILLENSQFPKEVSEIIEKISENIINSFKEQRVEVNPKLKDEDFVETFVQNVSKLDENELAEVYKTHVGVLNRIATMLKNKNIRIHGYIQDKDYQLKVDVLKKL